MCCERVTQGVGGDGWVKACLRSPLSHHRPYTAHAEAAARRVGEDRLAPFRRHPFSSKIVLQGAAAGTAEYDNPLLVALAANKRRSVLQVDVVTVEANHFADSETRT